MRSSPSTIRRFGTGGWPKAGHIGDPDAEFECAGVTESADADADPPEWYVGVPANNESHPIKPVCANVQGAGFAPAIEIIEDE